MSSKDNCIKSAHLIGEKDDFAQGEDKKCIMVIGGTGFIGAHVARFLAESGHQVFIYDTQRPTSAMEWLFAPFLDSIHYIKGSITDLSVLLHTLDKHGINQIVNTSAITDVEILVNQPLTAHQVMVQGHLNVMEAARLMSIKRVVSTSSIAIYAPKQYEPIDEKHPVLLPTEAPTIASYSVWKLAIESSGLFYHAYHGVDCVFLRLSAVYGFGMNYPLYVKPFVEESLSGRPVRFETGGDMKRDYTYIDDVVSGIALALQAPKNLHSRLFNITCGGEMISGIQVAEEVRRQIPETDIKIKNGLSEFEKRDVKNRGVLSIKRAKQELGYQPSFTFQEGLKAYIRLQKKYLKDQQLN